ncbi:MAG: YggS family pyridoxal phosphate-dependent enzyme [Chlorobi bacterium]|nr:YggS family pyridoxal phosphate-dependent enzyme [Chlorobiota bacterium]
MAQSLCEKLEHYRSALPEGGILVAVSKTRPPEEIAEAYGCGHRDFGENKVQELRDKYPVLPPDIRWHMIGHLQRNKVKYIAPFVWLIHSVDSEKLLREIDRQAERHGRVIPVLFQIKIAEEDTKYGLSEEEFERLTDAYERGEFPRVRLKGLMGMATHTSDREKVRAEFRYLKSLFDRLQKRLPGIEFLSAGMTHDYEIALEEGANIIRIGSGIFGPRI